MARMLQAQALCREHAKRGGKRACYCCVPSHAGPQLNRQQRAIEKREWRKDQKD